MCSHASGLDGESNGKNENSEMLCFPLDINMIVIANECQINLILICCVFPFEPFREGENNAKSQTREWKCINLRDLIVCTCSHHCGGSVDWSQTKASHAKPSRRADGLQLPANIYERSFPFGLIYPRTFPAIRPASPPIRSRFPSSEGDGGMIYGGHNRSSDTERKT